MCLCFARELNLIWLIIKSEKHRSEAKRTNIPKNVFEKAQNTGRQAKIEKFLMLILMNETN